MKNERDMQLVKLAIKAIKSEYIVVLAHSAVIEGKKVGVFLRRDNEYQYSTALIEQDLLIEMLETVGVELPPVTIFTRVVLNINGDEIDLYSTNSFGKWTISFRNLNILCYHLLNEILEYE